MVKLTGYKREKEVLNELGIKPIAFSGSKSEYGREDGESDTLLAQVKSTQGKAASVRKLDWDQLDKHALIVHKVPVFVLDFADSDEVLICFRPRDIKKVYKHFRKKDAQGQD